MTVDEAFKPACGRAARLCALPPRRLLELRDQRNAHDRRDQRRLRDSAADAARQPQRALRSRARSRSAIAFASRRDPREDPATGRTFRRSERSPVRRAARTPPSSATCACKGFPKILFPSAPRPHKLHNGGRSDEIERLSLAKTLVGCVPERHVRLASLPTEIDRRTFSA